MDNKAFENLLDMPKELEGRVPALRVMPLPADSNVAGDVFGGWILSQMDLAGAVHAHRLVQNRIVTVGVEAMSFHEPVFIGDEVSFYTDVVKQGRTSVTIKICAWAFRRKGGNFVRVTEGLYTYVRIDPKTRDPLPIEG